MPAALFVQNLQDLRQFFQGYGILPGNFHGFGQIFLSHAQTAFPDNGDIPVRYEAAFSCNGFNEAFLFQIVVGAFGGNNADTQLFGEQPHAGQGIPRLQFAGYNVVFYLGSDLFIDGLPAGITYCDIQYGTSGVYIVYIFIYTIYTVLLSLSMTK